MLEYLPQAIASLSAAGNIAKTLVGIRDESKLNSTVIELQGCIIDAQSKVLSGQSEQAAAAKRIEALEAEITRLKDWASEREKYVLTQIGFSAFAYVPKEFTGKDLGDAVKLCPNCFEKGSKAIFQNNARLTGRDIHLVCPNRCPELNFHYFLEPKPSDA
jgi:hypothetical protein